MGFACNTGAGVNKFAFLTLTVNLEQDISTDSRWFGEKMPNRVHVITKEV